MSRRLSPVAKAGLLVLAVISVGDLAGPLLTDGEHPPMSIALIGCAIGAISIVFAVLAWRSGRLGWAVGLVALRVLSAATAVPAFVIPDVPVIARVLAGVLLLATVVGSGLVVAGFARHRALVTA